MPTLDRADHRPPHHVRCGLEYGHRGPHVALVQTLGAQETAAWLLAWAQPGDPRSLVEMPYCCDDRGGPDACLLPDGHEGDHSPDLITMLAPPRGVGLLTW